MSEPAYFSHPRPEMLRYLPEPAACVLDVGCGAGAFAAAVRERGAEVWGIELDPAAAVRAAARLDRVLTGDAILQAAETPDSAFDCIFLNDVLEHLDQPQDLLRTLSPKLARGGRLVASIPNVSYFHNLWDLVVHDNWRYVDEGILDRTHLRFFTRRSILELFESCGFEVESIEGIHATGSWRFKIFNLLTLGACSRMRWLQYACVARPAAAGSGEDR